MKSMRRQFQEKETVKKSFAFTDEYGKPFLEFARASYLENSYVICIYTLIKSFPKFYFTDISEPNQKFILWMRFQNVHEAIDTRIVLQFFSIEKMDIS